MLGAVALFTACSDDGGSGNGNINYEEGYKYLTNLNVSDAKMIYQKSSATRAIGDDSYYKLDLSGNEVKLSIKGEDGQDHNIGISKVVKLSDKIILVNPVEQDIVDLFYKPGPDDDYISVSNQSIRYLSIVDVQTEKLYRWPKDVHIDLYYGSLKTILDNQGNIYIASSNSNYPEYRQIYKLNVSDFTMQKMLPDEVIKLEHSSDKKEGIIKKKHTNKFIAFGQLMLLAMNVLKNSEEIHEENLKADSYTRILKNSISYVVLYKMICEEIINHFEEFPKERVEEFKFVLRFLPVIHQNLISDNLGTYKLAEVIKEKIEADKVSGNKAVISEFEKFLSVYLYCDIKGDGYKAIMGDFIKNINKTYIADSCFFKLLAYYYSSTTPSDDNSIVNLLADLYIKVNANKNSNKRINKSALIQKFKKEKAELE